MQKLAILISGSNYGAGKSTSAQILKERFEKEGKKCLICSFGDYVKMCLTKYYNWDGKKDADGRQLLQHFATDLVRKNDEIFWAEVLSRLCNAIKQDFDIFIIDDWRFENEYYAIRNFFTTRTICIERESAGTCSHASENGINLYPIDFFINNNGTTEELKNKLYSLDFSINI